MFKDFVNAASSGRLILRSTSKAIILAYVLTTAEPILLRVY